MYIKSSWKSDCKSKVMYKFQSRLKTSPRSKQKPFLLASLNILHWNHCNYSLDSSWFVNAVKINLDPKTCIFCIYKKNPNKTNTVFIFKMSLLSCIVSRRLLNTKALAFFSFSFQKAFFCTGTSAWLDNSLIPFHDKILSWGQKYALICWRCLWKKYNYPER